MGNRCDYKSSILPLPLFGEGEMDLPNAVRCPLYMMGLCWTFLGIAIISDIFMAGIEKVTSKKKRWTDPKTGRKITIPVWNATVANLTLMALGSSAPEILLSVIEITSNDMYLGDLGAGTIVGSAAFNLLCISAVCVSAIPDNDVRYIKETQVYIITATCSVFAYMWLMFVLMAPPSPNVCETWEAVLTLLFFPILIVLAFMADKGYFKSGEEKGEEKDMIGVIPENVTKDELVQIEQQIREVHGANLTNEQVVDIMKNKYFTQRSRAYYRHTAMQQSLGLKKVEAVAAAPPDLTVLPTIDTHDDVENDRKRVTLGFASARYAFLENCQNAQLVVVRQGPSNMKAMVKYRTKPGTAVPHKDYEPSEGQIVFDKEETKKTLFIKILDDDTQEENSEFSVELYEPVCEQGDDGLGNPCAARVSALNTAVVVIIDDDEPGYLAFEKEEIEAEEQLGVEQTQIDITVQRHAGASGIVGCSYYTEDMKAVAGVDYIATSGKIELGPSVQEATIPVAIYSRGRFDKTAGFNLVLHKPVGCHFSAETDGGRERCICHVNITGQKTEDREELVRKMESLVGKKQVSLGHEHWKQQFYDALFVVVDGDDDEEGEEGGEGEGPSKLDYFIHVLSLPFKLLFAFVPPVDYCNGWACFYGALCMIAVVTAFVGDMANLVGCTANINPEITAITFVALGTSLPDTFASKAAASLDAYADASIGNVTGSNSVNVFLGLGLSWTFAAFYWEFSAPTQEWTDKVFKPGGVYYDVREDVRSVMKNGKAVFVVPAGSLWFNLMVFSCNALMAIQHLYMRRRKWGGELGGPKHGFMGQYFSAGFLAFQWFIYVGASSIFATVNAKD